MNKFRKNTMYIWFIIIAAFISNYLIIRLSEPYTKIFSNNDVLVYKSILFEIGVFLFVLIAMFLGGFYIYQVWSKKELTYQNIFMLCLLFTGTLILSVAIYRYSPFAMPLVLIPLILTFISNKYTAIYMNIVMTLLMLPVIFDKPDIIFMNIFTGIIVGMIASRVNQRREFPVLGLAMTLCNVLVLFIFNTMRGFEFDLFLKDSAIVSAVTFGCVIATVGILPFFETISGIITPFQLMDLSNLTNKLLKRLVVEAPGTYYHSIMVGNLAEAAAEEIGANALLARVAAYYHDIGKLKSPIYFMENQHGENIHNNMDPYESKAIITAHTEDGVKIAQKYRLPPQIVEVIGQHHGDTQVAFFYNKACEEAGGSVFVNQEDFRYKNKKPSSKEAGIIMLADSVEAATKALTEKNQDTIAERINKVIDGKIIDGQLDECKLTLKDINIIKKQFAESIEAYYHKRDEYPDKEA